MTLSYTPILHEATPGNEGLVVCYRDVSVAAQLRVRTRMRRWHRRDNETRSGSRRGNRVFRRLLPHMPRR
jgi:hypothetical protein